MKKPFAIIAILTNLLVVSSLLCPNDTNAQGASLSIFPPVIEIDATPPSSPTAPIIIQNNSDTNLTLKIELIPFTTNGINGDIIHNPQLMEEGFYPYYRDRIQFLEADRKTSSIELGALESKEVMVNLNLTKGDPPGDFYYSIVFKTEGNEPHESSFSQIPVGIASNLLLSIGPKGEAMGGISEFTTSQFKTSGPVEFTLKLHNASNHLVAPSGKVTISNMFGQKVGSIDILPQYVLAGNDRYLIDQAQASNGAQLRSDGLTSFPKVIWGEKFLLGWYKATAQITLEENGKLIEATTYFIAFPLYFFFPLAMVLFIGISIYLKVRRKI